MKNLKDMTKWIALGHELLTYTEFKVFLQWYTDAPGFSAGAALVAQRLPGLDKGNIRKAYGTLTKKGFIKDSGIKMRNRSGSPTPLYILGNLEEVFKSAILKRSKRVDSCAKCIEISLKCVDLYPVACRCDGHSVYVDTHVLLKPKELEGTVKTDSAGSFKAPSNARQAKPKNQKDEKVPSSLVNSQIHEMLKFILANSEKIKKEDTKSMLFSFEEQIENAHHLSAKQIKIIEDIFGKLNNVQSNDGLNFDSDNGPIVTGRSEMDISKIPKLETDWVMMSDEEFIRELEGSQDG